MASLLLGLFILPAGAAADTLSEVRARGELHWGADVQGGEPYAFEDPEDPNRAIGFEVEIADAIARRLGVRAVLVQTTWSNLVPSLMRGSFDVILNGLEATPARRGQLLLSEPYYVFTEQLAVREGSALRFSDLRGKRVGTLNQTYARDLLVQAGIEPMLYEGVQEPYLDLEQGRLDAVLLDSIVALRYGCRRPGIRCLDDEIAESSYAIGLRPDDQALLGAINGALEDMRRDGELRRILERWRLYDARQGSRPALAERSRPPRTLGPGELGQLLSSAGITLALTLVSFGLAVPLGLALALARLYGGRGTRALAGAYVEAFRGTPVLFQLYLLYFSLAPLLRLDPFQAACAGLALNYAAYESEVYRGAIQSVPTGQAEAGRMLGLSPVQNLRHVLLPQAFRVALPAMTNDLVALLKDSAVVGVIAVVDLTKRMAILSVDLGDWVAPGLLSAALYLGMSVGIARAARLVERRFRSDPSYRLA